MLSYISSVQIGLYHFLRERNYKMAYTFDKYGCLVVGKDKREAAEKAAQVDKDYK